MSKIFLTRIDIDVNCIDCIYYKNGICDNNFNKKYSKKAIKVNTNDRCFNFKRKDKYG